MVMYTYSPRLTTYGTYEDDDNDDDDDDNDKSGDSIKSPYFNVFSQNKAAFNSNGTAHKITKNCNKKDQWWWCWWW